MSEIKQSIIRITALGIAVIFSVVCFIFGNLSNAWFASNNDVNAINNGFMASYNDDFDTIKYYRITATELVSDGANSHNDYIFVTDNSALEGRPAFTTPITLNTYSDLEGNAQVLMEVTLKDDSPLLDYQNLTISIQTTTNEFFGDTLESLDELAEFTVDPNGNNPMSSIISYWAFSAVETGTHQGSPCYVVPSNTIGSVKTFVDVDENDVAQFAVPQAMQVPIVNKKFFIMFDYNEKAVELINTQLASYVDRASAAIQGYDTILLGETHVNFACDFLFVVSEGEV